MKSRTQANVLIVEDEFLVAMLIQDHLEDLGFKNVAHRSTIDGALVRIRERRPDLCFLDVNLGGQTSFGIATKLKADNAPFAFLSGHGSTSFPEEWRAHPALTKPFTHADLAHMVARLEA